MINLRAIVKADVARMEGGAGIVLCSLLLNSVFKLAGLPGLD
jgi:hypothetical protein